MVQLRYSFLALFLAGNFTWASPQESRSTGFMIEKRQYPNDQFIFRSCPSESRKCSECGGDSKKKGFCDTELAHGSSIEYSNCLKRHGENNGCGLVCKCTSEETGEPGTGLPPVIPFPLPPAGFVPPPAGVPNPEKICNEDFTQTSCKGCEPKEGWCTKGDNAGCPCREDCPADDDDSQATCSADDCKGEKGSCTIGHYKDCKCKVKCPDSEKSVLLCSSDVCKSEDDEKCTTVRFEPIFLGLKRRTTVGNLAQDEYDGCDCAVSSTNIHTIRSKADVQADEDTISILVEDMKKFYEGDDDDDDNDGSNDTEDLEVTCKSKNYNDAIKVDTSFMNKLARKFCDGGMDKQRSQDLTGEDLESSAFGEYKFHFELNPGDGCETDCEAVFKSMFGKCQGIDSHSIQASASAESEGCGASFSYEISSFPRPVWKDRVCHNTNQWGDHGDVREWEITETARFCLRLTDEEATLKAGSNPITYEDTKEGTDHKHIISWIENCEGTEMDVRYPTDEEEIIGNSCYWFLVQDWKQCNNGGAGGYIDYGCVRYDFRPSFD
ncbi:uncharacterized protein BDV14DRAFT_195824 [Aspergillus stella-maris]|uniref:uncharacterized protein n=1 Tax=Aspergillus stella-maris TaxID=1810926 RepID=UPI003CCC8F69